MIFRLVQSDSLEPGEIILDKEGEVIFYRDIIDWFNFLKEYNNENSASSKE